MKFLLTMNQIAYFKPETSARRLKEYYDHGEGNPVIFLGYLRLIRLLPALAPRAKDFQPDLYRKEVREIFLDTPWEEEALGWLALFLPEFREFFTTEEWHYLKIRHQRLHPFLANLVVPWFQKAQHVLFLQQAMKVSTILSKSQRRQSIKLRC